MNSTVEKLSSNKVRIAFTATPEEFEKGMASAYKKLVKQINIPGFRRGHAPRKVIELHYGPSVFYEDAFDAIFPDMYKQAIDEHNLEPVDRPSLDVQKMGVNEPLEFTVEVYVKPDVELGQYMGLEIERSVTEVTDDDVGAELERARERVARFVDVERPIKLDDQVNIDYAGTVDGVAFDGGSATGHNLVIGSGSFIPGFEEQLIGANVSDELDVHVTFPEQYHAEALAGKPAMFHVKINSVQEKDMPALDDEFAKDVSEFDTLDEYRADIRKNLVKQAEDKADAAFENEVLDAAVENAKVDIPEAMIEDQITSMLREMEMRMMMQGMRMADFLKYTGQTEEQMREMYKEEAESRVRTQLVLEAIREKEAVTATDEEIDAEMAQYAEQSKKSLDEFKATLSDSDKEYFAKAAAMKKTIKMLTDAVQ